MRIKRENLINPHASGCYKATVHWAFVMLKKCYNISLGNQENNFLGVPCIINRGP